MAASFFVAVLTASALADGTACQTHGAIDIQFGSMARVIVDGAKVLAGTDPRLLETQEVQPGHLRHDWLAFEMGDQDETEYGWIPLEEVQLAVEITNTGITERNEGERDDAIRP